MKFVIDSKDVQLLKNIKVAHDSEAMKSLFVMNHVHGLDYNGPKFDGKHLNELVKRLMKKTEGKTFDSEGKRICDVPVCDATHAAYGLCIDHYCKWHRTGRTLTHQELAEWRPKRSKFTPELARQIEEINSTGKNLTQIAKEIGCSLGSIYQWRKAGKFSYVPPPARTCDELDCANKHYQHGKCMMHFTRIRQGYNGRRLEGRKSSIEERQKAMEMMDDGASSQEVYEKFGYVKPTIMRWRGKYLEDGHV